MHADPELLPGDSIRAVKELAEAFQARSIRYALIGGLAFVLRGRPRFTRDVDFLLEVPQIQLPGLLDDLIKRGFAIDPSVIIKEYVREHVTAFPFGNVRIDWLKPVLPLYSRTLLDATSLEWMEGVSVRVATAEGLILTKMVAFRPQDQVDIDTLLTANRDDIDVALIREEWSPFAATEPERTAWLEAAIARRVIRRE
jgi:predicted nucleotidyltransferase